MAAMLSRTGEFGDCDRLRRNFAALNEQRNLSRFCDVVLRVCNTEIYAHANVLAAASPYFSSFLGTGTDCPRTFCQKQPQVIEIHIDSVSMTEGDGGYGEAVSKVVDYMYTSKITLTTTLVSQIIEIGKIMLLDKLLEFCFAFQKGINDNRPRSVFTCTSGLQEVVSLLSERTKIVKRVDASTDTDESLFAKLRCLSPVSLNLTDSDVLDVVPEQGSLKSSETITNIPNNNLKDSSTDIIDCIVQEKSLNSDMVVKNEETPDSPSCVSETPSLFDDTFGQPSIAVTDLQGDIPIKSENETSVANPPCLNSATEETYQTVETNASSTVESLEHFSAMESFAEIMHDHVPLPKDFPTAPDLTSEKSENVKQSDVLQSQDVPVALKKAENVSEKVPLDSLFISTTSTEHRRRGRARGRGRGRGRRGRPPGRPRKVKDPESDHEFDEFMKHLEKGDDTIEDNNDQEKRSVNPDEPVDEMLTDCSSAAINDMVSKNEDPDYSIPINIRRDLPSSSTHGLSTMWKSPRIRSKPSQLKKDYVFHSLSRKTRKAQGVSSHERSPVPRPISTGGPSSLSKVSKSLRFVCQKCDFSTSAFRDYRQHLRSHPETDPRYYICQKCDFKTTRSRVYTSHKQMHMITEFICVLCEYQAANSTEYQEHMDKHSGDYPYFCAECDSRFKKKNQLMSHNRKHQLVKPFICAVCDAGFKWKHALKNHMITHSASKDHLCDVCGYATAHKSQLKAHRLIHTGQTFKCVIPGCHFEATKRQKLKYHMVTHTNEKPHQCDICGQRFSLNKNMRRHMLLHTNTRPYACKMCSFTTTRYDKLKEHNFKLHNIGGASVPKKVPVDYLAPTVTYVKSDSITMNPDGTFSEEALQTIAQLATSQQTTDLGATQAGINVEQPTSDGAPYPIIARVQFAQVDDGALQFITEIAE